MTITTTQNVNRLPIEENISNSISSFNFKNFKRVIKFVPMSSVVGLQPSQRIPLSRSLL